MRVTPLHNPCVRVSVRLRQTGPRRNSAPGAIRRRRASLTPASLALKLIKTEIKMAHGGKRTGAGRPAGAATVKTREIADAVVASGEMTPLEFMLKVMNNESADDGRRLDAAKSAAPYVHARLSSIEHKGDVDNPVEIKMQLNEAVREFTGRIARVAVRRGAGEAPE
jgi:hypothetical protein